MPEVSDLKEVTIYTDGAAVPNPGKGGYGVVLRFGNRSKELSGGSALTTNNRMELMAVCAGLEALKERCRVKLHCDSRYIVDAVKNGSAFRWRESGWAMNASKTKFAKNVDLWERLLAAYERYERHDGEMIWVKGHAGIQDNERCDELATAASNQLNAPADPGYNPEPKDVSTAALLSQPLPPNQRPRSQNLASPVGSARHPSSNEPRKRQR